MARKNRLQLGLTLDFSAKSEKVEDSDFVHLMYRIVASASPSRFEAHVSLFRLHTGHFGKIMSKKYEQFSIHLTLLTTGF